MKHTRSSTRTLIMSTLAIFIIGLMHPDAFCQEDEKKHRIGVSLTTPTMTSIAGAKSAELNIDHKAWMIEMGLQAKLFDLVGISAELGYGAIKDHGSFTQNTTWGTLESSFTTLSYDFKAGLWTPEVRLIKKRDVKFCAGAWLGIEGFSGRREIVNCKNCDVEKYSFQAGFFIEPEINFFFYKDILGIGTSYRYFFGDNDINYSWAILKLMYRTGI